MFQEFTGMAWPFAALGFLLFAAAYGIVFATWAWATRLITRGTSWNVAWVSQVVWTAVEKFCPEIFPVYLGASQYNLTFDADRGGDGHSWCNLPHRVPSWKRFPRTGSLI
jgi:apolipoprotein N-acyltransferase